VKEAWEDIPAEMVRKSFLKSGISNRMDGTKDDNLWQESEKKSEEDEPVPATWDTYEQLTQDWQDLCGESDAQDSDLEGF